MEICVGFYCRAWFVLFLWPDKWIIGLCRDLDLLSSMTSLFASPPPVWHKQSWHIKRLHRRRSSRSTCLALERSVALSHWHDGVWYWWQPFSHPHCSLRIRYSGYSRKRKRKIWIFSVLALSLSLSLSDTSTAIDARAGGWHSSIDWSLVIGMMLRFASVVHRSFENTAELESGQPVMPLVQVRLLAMRSMVPMVSM